MEEPSGELQLNEMLALLKAKDDEICRSAACSQVEGSAQQSDSLTADVLSLIFLKLGQLPGVDVLRAMAVCKQWRAVAVSEPNLWTNLDFSSFPGVQDNDVVRVVRRAHGCVTFFSIKSCNFVTDTALEALHGCLHLEEVHAGSNQVTGAGVLSLVTGLKEAKKGLPVVETASNSLEGFPSNIAESETCENLQGIPGPSAQQPFMNGNEGLDANIGASTTRSMSRRLRFSDQYSDSERKMGEAADLVDDKDEEESNLFEGSGSFRAESQLVLALVNRRREIREKRSRKIRKLEAEDEERKLHHLQLELLQLQMEAGDYDDEEEDPPQDDEDICSEEDGVVESECSYSSPLEHFAIGEAGEARVCGLTEDPMDREQDERHTKSSRPNKSSSLVEELQKSTLEEDEDCKFTGHPASSKMTDVGKVDLLKDLSSRSEGRLPAKAAGQVRSESMVIESQIGGSSRVGGGSLSRDAPSRRIDYLTVGDGASSSWSTDMEGEAPALESTTNAYLEGTANALEGSVFVRAKLPLERPALRKLWLDGISHMTAHQHEIIRSLVGWIDGGCCKQCKEVHVLQHCMHCENNFCSVCRESAQCAECGTSSCRQAPCPPITTCQACGEGFCRTCRIIWECEACCRAFCESHLRFTQFCGISLQYCETCVSNNKLRMRFWSCIGCMG